MLKTRMRADAVALAATLTLAFAAAAPAAAGAAGAVQESVVVGGAPMYPTRNIVENAVNSRDHTTLVAAVQAAGLAETLAGTGPFTVFAPTNAAFERLPAGTVQNLLVPANRPMLQSVLTYHVVPGRLTAADLMRMIRDGGGETRLTTVQGGTLRARMSGSMIVLWDAAGGTATVTQADVIQSNGVIHVTDAVSLPGADGERTGRRTMARGTPRG